MSGSENLSEYVQPIDLTVLKVNNTNDNNNNISNIDKTTRKEVSSENMLCKEAYNKENQHKLPTGKMHIKILFFYHEIVILIYLFFL